ncbi:MAG: hypothetical protein ACK4J1_12740, partial [Hylemonella sp.]
MINISKQTNRLLLTYRPDRFNDARWLDEKLGKVCSTPAPDAAAGVGFHIMGSVIVSASFQGCFCPLRGL